VYYPRLHKYKETDKRGKSFWRKQLFVILALLLVMAMFAMFAGKSSAVKVEANITLSEVSVICNGKRIMHTDAGYARSSLRIFVKRGKGSCLLRRPGCKPLTFSYDTSDRPQFVKVEFNCEK